MIFDREKENEEETQVEAKPVPKKKKRKKKRKRKLARMVHVSVSDAATKKISKGLMRFKILHPFKDKKGNQHAPRDGYLDMDYEDARIHVRRRKLMLSRSQPAQR